MRRGRSGSLTSALRRSLLAGLTLLWLVGVVGSGFVLERLIAERSDEELEESGALLMSLLSNTDDLALTAAVLRSRATPAGADKVHQRIMYQLRDASGRTLLRSPDAPREIFAIPAREGFATVGAWRVLTLLDRDRGRTLQMAEPLAERREALVTALLWLTLPLTVLLGFTAFIVFRASRSLVTQVERTATAVSRQDPQALGLLPLDDVVTEMRPAVEATNRLLGRLADALESERSFTYNSAHELRTPIAGALAQAQLLAAMTKGGAAEEPAASMVSALSRLARLAERLLALARAEGTHPLADDLVDLPAVVKFVAGEFRDDARLHGREIVVEASPARVVADLDAVGLALRNLVENAMVHAPTARKIRIACETLSTGVVLRVEDDGMGVPRSRLPSLTQRFVRGSGAPAGGAGLGLSIVATLARRMGAELTIESPGEGPRHGFTARLTWPASHPGRSRRPRGERVGEVRREG
ncbi:MAG: HAMP domain-containing sensor histidine kinase [Burkholderiales bacterium]